MDKIQSIPFTQSMITFLADELQELYINKGKSLENMALVFGGARPALFLKKELARRIGRAFIPPKFFTMDSFVDEILKGRYQKSAQDLDHAYILYKLTQEEAPELLMGRERFSDFLPWAREIYGFINQLDLEDVSSDRLKNVESAASIGFDVPDDINALLMRILKLRERYHAQQEKTGAWARGYRYLKAAQLVDQRMRKAEGVLRAEEAVDALAKNDESAMLVGVDEILFSHFFYFHKTEEQIVSTLVSAARARVIFQGDARRWPVLKRAEKIFGAKISEGKDLVERNFDLKLYAGFDIHAQVAHAREILQTIPEKELSRTVVVLPHAGLLIPFISEAAAMLKQYNVSMGYPLKRSSLNELLGFIFEAQLSLYDGGYRTRAYLKVLRHPFVKNFKSHAEREVTRVLVHKIEDALTGAMFSILNGSLFVDTKMVEKDQDLLGSAQQTLGAMGLKVSSDELLQVLVELHQIFFKDWENQRTVLALSEVLTTTLQLLMEKSPAVEYPLNTKVAFQLFAVAQELKLTPFKDEEFGVLELFRVVKDRIDREIVPFKGSPLRGLQVLGLFETRSLDFDHVIMLDVNEGSLPSLTIHEPLIPREILVSLGLSRVELEEEIQRYQFMRLISGARRVHLIYDHSPASQRSRFIEELVWEKEQILGLGSVPVLKGGFEVEITPRQKSVQKTPQMIEHLKSLRYSASSLNTYVENPMTFYYRYVLGLRDKDDLLDEPEGARVGSFIHEVLEKAFRSFVGKVPLIDEAFRKRLLQEADERFDTYFGRGGRSDAFLVKAIVESRLNRFCDKEADVLKRGVSKIAHIEETFSLSVPTSQGDIDLTARIDRVDEMENGELWVIDYKTGSADVMPPARKRNDLLGDLSRKVIFDSLNSFQMPLYHYCFTQMYSDRSIKAVVYNLRTLDLKSFSMESDQEREMLFLRPVRFILDEILDLNTPFIEDDLRGK